MPSTATHSCSRSSRRPIAAACLIAIVGSAALADVPTYKGFQIQASTGDILFNLPGDASLSSATPDINDNHEVTFSYFGVDRRAIWYGVDGVGAEIQNIPFNGGFFSVSDPTINNNSLIAYTRDDGSNMGVWAINPLSAAPVAAFQYAMLSGVSAYTGGRIADNGRYGFRANANFTDFLGDTPAGGPASVIAIEDSFSMPSQFSFIASPSYNNNRQWACRVFNDAQASGQDDEVRRFEADGSSVRLVGEGDAIDGSTITQFFNNVGLGDSGAIAVACRLADGREALVFANDSGVTLLSSEADPDINEYRIFDPDINQNDLVVYRALDARNEDSIYVVDGNDPGAGTLKLATVGTEIEGPSGEMLFIGRFIDSSPSLGGAPKINTLGSVVFNAQLNDGTDLRGAAMIVAAVLDDGCPADLSGDGVLNNTDVNLFVSAFLAMDAAADFNSDGNFNNTDVNLFVAAFLAGCG